MNTITGTFLKIITSNTKQRFLISSQNENSPYIICEGDIPLTIYGIPYELEGEYNNSVFYVSNYGIKTANKNDVFSFLSHINIEHIGVSKINKIAEIVDGNNLFELVKDRNWVENVLAKVIKEDATNSLLEHLNKIINTSETYKLIKEYEIGPTNINKIINKYGSASKEVINNNPYKLIRSGLSLLQCDVMAYKNNIPSFDEKRIHAITQYLLKRNESIGNTKISYNDFCDIYYRHEQNSPYTTDHIFFAEELLKDDYKVIYEDNDYYIYLKDTYNAEQTIAKKIIQLNDNKKDLQSESKISIQELESLCQITYSQKQKEAIELANTTGIKIITGGPGTGKTTVENGIIKKYQTEHPNAKILLCAPTGCAAKRMTEATGIEAKTLHKALDIRPFMDNETFNSLIDGLEYDCIIVDEVSMMDTKIASLLFKNIKSDTLFILVGDKDQLSSVGCGNVLSDLLQNHLIETVELNVNYRQGYNNSIIINAEKIKRGDTSLIKDGKTHIKTCTNSDAMVKEALKIYERLYDRNNPNKVKLYTPTRKFDTGSIELNNCIKQRVNPSGSKYFYSNGYEYSEGDLVIMNRNNYTKGYFNGDVGYIEQILIDGIDIQVRLIVDNEEIIIENSELSDMELGYVNTIHKSQGAECENAIIILPKEPQIMLTRNLLYVASTRAKGKNYIFEQGSAIYQCIKQKKKKQRKTGLSNRVKEHAA